MRAKGSRKGLNLLALAVLVAVGAFTQAQSGTQGQSQPPANAQPQNIPDAPSTVQPPAPKPIPETSSSKDTQQEQGTEPLPGANPPSEQPQPEHNPPPPKMPPVETVPPGTDYGTTQQGPGPRNQINPAENLYKFVVATNFVQIPVMVKDGRGRMVDGLLPKDFTVLENGKPQTLSYFTSDPFQLSAAIVLDLGMPDIALQKVNQTYSALVGAFSPYDEYALYTYSSTVSQMRDFTSKPESLSASLESLKLVRGYPNGPPVLSGPLGPQGPMVNGMPVGTNGPPPVYTPPKESHVLNDAILRAALDLAKRDRARRKVIFVISDGRERGSQASYKQVLKLLETHGIQVKAVVLDQGALPVYKQVEKVHHVFNQGYANILPKYTNATGGGDPFTELTRNSIEQAYAQITSEARNQYTLGYTPQAVKGSAAYRTVEVQVDKAGLNIYTKSGYYPVPVVR